MLNNQDYIDGFLRIQAHCLEATKIVAQAAKPGISEQQLADIYHAQLAQEGLTKFWYPTLICAGKYSGQPLTRRNHLPDANIKLRANDIVILDTTPMKETIWGNWTITESIGTDPFYHQLCADIFLVVIEAATEALRGPPSLGQIHAFCMERAKALGLENIDPRGNAGHSIFQVPANQTVDQTPLEDRAFIDAQDRSFALPFLMSIEPELARVNPADGVRYGGKFQFIIPLGYGESGLRLIKSQYDFYRDMALIKDNQPMLDGLEGIGKYIAAAKPNAKAPDYSGMK